MGFDASRPVPWKLLLRRFGIMFVAMVVLVSLTSRQSAGGLVTGLLFGGVLFFAMSWLLSKFGYAPKTMAEIRADAARRAEARGTPPERATRRRRGAVAPTATGRPAPPPTKRTASGVGRHPQPRKR